MELATARIMAPQQAASAAACSNTRIRCLQPGQLCLCTSKGGLSFPVVESGFPSLSCSVPLRSLRGDLASGASCLAHFEVLTGFQSRAAGRGAVGGLVEPSSDNWTADDARQATRSGHRRRQQGSYRFLQRCLRQERSTGEVGPVQMSLPKATSMRRCCDQQPYGIPDRRVPAYWDVVGLGQAMVSSCGLESDPRCAHALGKGTLRGLMCCLGQNSKWPFQYS